MFPKPCSQFSSFSNVEHVTFTAQDAVYKMRRGAGKGMINMILGFRSGNNGRGNCAYHMETCPGETASLLVQSYELGFREYFCCFSKIHLTGLFFATLLLCFSGIVAFYNFPSFLSNEGSLSETWDHSATIFIGSLLIILVYIYILLYCTNTIGRY